MKLNWIQKMLFLVNIFLAMGLLLANFSYSFEPSTYTFGYLIGLSYPYFLGLNLLFALFWLYSKKLHFILSIAVMGLGYTTASNMIALNWKTDNSDSTHFTVMSFNVRLLNQYNWLDDPTTRDRIFHYIEKTNPDIVCFQEFFESKKKGTENIKRMKSLGYPYVKKEPGSSKSKRENFFGLITFSKYKILDSGKGYEDESRHKSISFFTDIKIDNQIVRLYNTHLNSLGFLPEDYKFVENITNTSEEEAIRKSKTILSKVMVAARNRQEEVTQILKKLEACEYPVIVLGDFNEPPYSYAYPRFTETLNDPFLQYGFGIGTTFDGISTIPGLRLDYILHSKQLQSTSYKVGPKKLSDHRSLIAGFRISK
ncbi:MAG: endonuclease/exonuclease/phosphatase (EEP) superfamily protein YafD [Salibacteraceae bacterium]|jgi:endonuclease/exonuclease/phosphatase (EEP) superfamily protein YafD